MLGSFVDLTVLSYDAPLPTNRYRRTRTREPSVPGIGAAVSRTGRRVRYIFRYAEGRYPAASEILLEDR